MLHKYYKYKTKYLQLKQSGGDALVYQLNNYVYRPIGKYHDQIGRLYVLMLSINLTDKIISRFTYYLSTGEGGFFRLCVYDSIGHADKGSTYITSTFVHIELQLFIHQHLDQIPTVNPESYLEYTCHPSLRSDKIFQRIHDKSRIIENDVLYPISLCIPGVCLREGYWDKFVDSLSKEADKWTELETKKKERDDLLQKYKATKKLNQDENKKMQMLGIDIGNLSKNRQKLMHSYELREALENHIQTTELKKLTLTEQIKIVYAGISDYVAKYFSAGTNEKQKLGSFVFSESGIKLVHALYSLPIYEKNQYLFDLVYSDYIYTNENDHRYDGNYQAIINLIPTNARSDEFGLYSLIVDPGIYIYKIFDYVEQCKLEDLFCFQNRYAFLGPYLSDVWPLSI